MERHFRVTENNFCPLRFPYRQGSLYTANFVKFEVCYAGKEWIYYMKSMKCLSSNTYVDHTRNLRVRVSTHNLGYQN